MDENKFNSLAIDAVGHACFEPMVPIYQDAIRGHGSQTAHEVRAEFYKSLSQGQRALFMFYSYYDHAIQSIDEFQRISNYYLSAHIFSVVKKAAEYFCDDDMLHLLFQIEQSMSDNEESKVSELYQRLHEISPHTLEIIGACIKKNPSEFIVIEELCHEEDSCNL